MGVGTTLGDPRPGVLPNHRVWGRSSRGGCAHADLQPGLRPGAAPDDRAYSCAHGPADTADAEPDTNGVPGLQGEYVGFV